LKETNYLELNTTISVSGIHCFILSLVVLIQQTKTKEVVYLYQHVVKNHYSCITALKNVLLTGVQNEQVMLNLVVIGFKTYLSMENIYICFAFPLYKQ